MNGANWRPVNRRIIGSLVIAVCLLLRPAANLLPRLVHGFLRPAVPSAPLVIPVELFGYDVSLPPIFAASDTGKIDAATLANLYAALATYLQSDVERIKYIADFADLTSGVLAAGKTWKTTDRYPRFGPAAATAFVSFNDPSQAVSPDIRRQLVARLDAIAYVLRRAS